MSAVPPIKNITAPSGAVMLLKGRCYCRLRLRALSSQIRNLRKWMFLNSLRLMGAPASFTPRRGS